MKSTHPTGLNMTTREEAELLIDGLLERTPRQQRKIEIFDRLRKLGVKWWGLMHSEVDELPMLLHSDETLHGVLLGQSKDGYILLAATNKRILYIDKKPFFLKTDDIAYNVVSGVTFEWIGLSGIVVLHTRMGSYKVKTTNQKAASIFHSYIDSRCIEVLNKEDL